MKKIIILLILMVSLTGCEAVYNLDINSDTFNEELVLTTHDKSTKTKKTVNIALKSNIPVDNDFYKPEVTFKQNNLKYYQILKIDTDNELGVRYKASLTKEEYQSSTIVKEHYPNFKLNETGNIVSLTLGKGNIFDNYPDLEKLTINITTNKRVTKHNADGVNSNTYTWYLTKDNYNKKEIYFNYSKTEKHDKNDENTFNYNIIFIITGIILITLATYIAIKAKNTGK